MQEQEGVGAQIISVPFGDAQAMDLENLAAVEPQWSQPLTCKSVNLVVLAFADSDDHDHKTVVDNLVNQAIGD